MVYSGSLHWYFGCWCDICETPENEWWKLFFGRPTSYLNAHWHSFISIKYSNVIFLISCWCLSTVLIEGNWEWMASFILILFALFLFRSISEPIINPSKVLWEKVWLSIKDIQQCHQCKWTWSSFSHLIIFKEISSLAYNTMICSMISNFNICKIRI